ncbi:MAG: nuclear transport factor 2 family protein [Roseovarius sp.]
MTDAVLSNKDVVAKFIAIVFNGHHVDEGAEACIGPTYRQHNPDVADGRDAFIASFKDFFAQHPQSTFDVKRMFEEGDHVTVHAHWKFHPDDRGYAVMDIFRLENGKIVEHWDAVQPIPETLAHSNTMF